MAEATGLSESTVGRVWKAHGLEPHLFQTFKVGKRLKAVQVTVLPAADPRLLSTQVRADLPAELPSGIVPGTAAKVLVPIGRSRKLVVPAAAVVRRGELTAVYVLADSTRQLRQVRVGNRVDGDAVEVLAGLAAGERVAVDPSRGTGAI